MKFHTEILSKKQKSLISFVQQFSDDFVLVGGTAIALQLWHRKSIDFDLFIEQKESLPLRKIWYKLNPYKWKYKVLINEDFHREVLLDWVKITWFAYIFEFSSTQTHQRNDIKMPSLLHLGAMKVHAIGKRAKWKDYVDMYFLIKKFGIEQICKYAKDFFGWEVNIKLFVSQLVYFDDIDYSEKIEWMDGFEVSDEEIKEFLVEHALVL